MSCRAVLSVDRQVDGQTNVLWTDEPSDGWMDGWMKGRKEGPLYHFSYVFKVRGTLFRRLQPQWLGKQHGGSTCKKYT